MNVFNWLVMGHLVGDFLLQNDWMATNKQRSLYTTAGFVHFTLYTLCITVALRIANLADLDGQRYLWFSLIVFVSHWLIDATDLARHWTRIAQQSDKAFVRLMVDQTFHLLVLTFLSSIMLE